jgi:hypothetical protein
MYILPEYDITGKVKSQFMKSRETRESLPGTILEDVDLALRMAVNVAAYLITERGLVEKFTTASFHTFETDTQQISE